MIILMPTVTLKNIPDPLYEKLKEAARIHHRSLNSEILYCVERTLNTYKIDIDEHLRIARQLRVKTTNHPLTDQQINEAKNQGRP
jgi:antitoxin FitA